MTKPRLTIEQELDKYILADRNMTGQWYRKMCGEVPWAEGERDFYSRMFESYSRTIESLRMELENALQSSTRQKSIEFNNYGFR